MNYKKVLIVTGSAVMPESLRIDAILSTIRKQLSIFRSSSGAWLDIAIKLEILEYIFLCGLERKSLRFRSAKYRETVDDFFRSLDSIDVPELGEVVLMTLLRSERIPFEAVTFGQLCADKHLREKLLNECGCVFLSTTYLRDMAELEVMASMLKQPRNKMIVGGALVNLLHQRWEPSPWIDVLAIGYGEYLVPVLAEWIKSEYRHLKPSNGTRLVRKGNNLLLYSGNPASKSLDDLPSPDWTLSRHYHSKSSRLVLYESARGCPYRCGFCNYPFLFNDTKFRTRSADKIAEDWEKLSNQGIEYISCLDSLFTIPRRRLKRLCQLLIARKLPIKWVCFARADDLRDLGICYLMKEAGCVKVLIGIESGSQKILDNMSKQCSVESNALAIQNCSAVGITSSISLIIGYPGETEDTVRETYDFLSANPPDLTSIYVFSIRSEGLPVLNDQNVVKYGLRLSNNSRAAHPYWLHDTMSCVDALRYSRWLKEEIAKNQISLEGTTFYGNSLDWDREERTVLLEYQKDAVTRHKIVRRGWSVARNWANRRLERDVRNRLNA